MRVAVDSKRCQGHAQCEAVSEFFTLDEEGYSSIGASKDVPVDLEDEALLGVETCPERALSIVAH